MSRQPGEYRLYPVDEEIFIRWVDRHPDYHHPIQYGNNLLVVVVVYPPHDRSSSIIIQEVKAEIDRMCAPGRARLSTGTGCIDPFQRSGFLIFSDEIIQRNPQEFGCCIILT
jgi:hypothetical protein